MQQASILREFRDFVLRGNVLELAIAIVLGIAFNVVVSSFVDDILMQIVAGIFGEPNFGGLTVDFGDSKIFYGSFLNAMISFLAVAAAIFFFVIKPLNALMARVRSGQAPPEAAPPTPEEIELLREIRDLLQVR